MLKPVNQQTITVQCSTKNIYYSVNQSFSQSIKFTQRILNFAYRPTVSNYCLFPVILHIRFQQQKFLKVCI